LPDSIKSFTLKGLLNARIIPAKKFSPISLKAKPITNVNTPALAKIPDVKSFNPKI